MLKSTNGFIKAPHHVGLMFEDYQFEATDKTHLLAVKSH